MEYVVSDFQGASCEVFFFKRWGTYSHPVKPLDPVEYEDALVRNGYVRAWMCGISGQDQFVFLEAKKNKLEITKVKKPSKKREMLKFYEAISDNDELDLGRELSPGETISRDVFFVSFSDDADFLSIVRQKLSYSYQYIYDANNALKQVILTGDDGDVSTLNY